MNPFANPELLRNARAQLRPRKLLSVAAICLLLSVSVGYLFAQGAEPTKDWARDLLDCVLMAQALVLGGGGSIACLTSIFREKERNSFDFQRVSSLTPLELAIGKLFGAPILMYFIFLCLMPVSMLAAVLAKCGLSFYIAAYIALLAASLTLNALGLLMSVLAIRGSQTGGIILMLLLLWVSAYGGDITNYSVFRLRPLGPFFAQRLVTQTSWDVSQLEYGYSYSGVRYEANLGVTDAVFGKRVHHFPVLIVIDAALLLWFFLAIVRNIKRDPEEYEIYSPAQSLGFAVFLSFVFVAFFNWSARESLSGEFLLGLNTGVLVLLGLTLLRNRQRMRHAIWTKGGAPSLLDHVWPSPWNFAAALSVGAIVVGSTAAAGAGLEGTSLAFLALRVVFLALWLVRDQQYLQWASLRRGRNPLVMGALYLVIFYVCASALLAALDCFNKGRIAFSAFFLPTPVFELSEKTWAQQSAVWLAAYFVQALLIGFFLLLQKKEVAAIAAPVDAPASDPVGSA